MVSFIGSVLLIEVNFHCNTNQFIELDNVQM